MTWFASIVPWRCESSLSPAFVFPKVLAGASSWPVHTHRRVRAPVAAPALTCTVTRSVLLPLTLLVASQQSEQSQPAANDTVGRRLGEALWRALDCEKGAGYRNIMARARHDVSLPRRLLLSSYAAFHHSAMPPIPGENEISLPVPASQGSGGRRFSEHIVGLLRTPEAVHASANHARLFGNALCSMESYDDHLQSIGFRREAWGARARFAATCMQCAHAPVHPAAELITRYTQWNCGGRVLLRTKGSGFVTGLHCAQGTRGTWDRRSCSHRLLKYQTRGRGLLSGAPTRLFAIFSAAVLTRNRHRSPQARNAGQADDRQ